MPAKTLTSPFYRKGKLKLFRFGGGKNTIIANDDPLHPGIGYMIDAGRGDDTVTGSSFDDDIIGGKGDDTINSGGGADTVSGGDGNDTLDGGGDNDTIDGGSGDDSTLGDLGNDTMTGGTGLDVIIGGLGSDWIYGGEIGGTDSDEGASTNSRNTLTGDMEFAWGLSANVTGETDHIFGGNGVSNDIYGDTQQVGYSAAVTFTGGDDTLVGGDSDGMTGATNNMVGDSDTDSLSGGGTFMGGVDTMIGGSGAGTTNDMWGEGFSYSGAGTFMGGADQIAGGSEIIAGDVVQNNMYGDVERLISVTSATGGKDTLIGGSGANVTNNMYGDFDVVTGSNVTGGNDTLISGTNANDTMTGDFNPDDFDFASAIGGADTFVFATSNGQDTIRDFEADKDKINLSGTAVVLAALDSDIFDMADGFINGDDDFVTIVGSDLVIDLGAAAGGTAGIDILTINGETQLATSDFDFMPLV
jgi:hypothetical protein